MKAIARKVIGNAAAWLVSMAVLVIVAFAVGFYAALAWETVAAGYRFAFDILPWAN